jgi:hypothetical protein
MEYTFLRQPVFQSAFQLKMHSSKVYQTVVRQPLFCGTRAQKKKSKDKKITSINAVI